MLYKGHEKNAYISLANSFPLGRQFCCLQSAQNQLVSVTMKPPIFWLFIQALHGMASGPCLKRTVI